MYRFTRVADKDFKKPEWITDLKRYNDLPQPYRVVDVNEYIHSSKVEVPHFRSFRQVRFIGETWKSEENLVEGYRNTEIMWYNGHAIAVVWPSKWKLNRVDHSVIYTEPIIYVKIGCDHDYEEVGPAEDRRRCLHTVRCDKCGHTYSYDSSD